MKNRLRARLFALLAVLGVLLGELVLFGDPLAAGARQLLFELGLSVADRDTGPATADLAHDGRSERRHVLLISVDTLRADHLSIYGYPRETTPQLQRFFGWGSIYDRAYATASFTTPSVASMLTGLLPSRHGVRLLYQRLSDEVVTLPDYLGAAGYETAAVVSNIVLTDKAFGVGGRFDHYDDRVDEPEPNREIWERRASRTTAAALDWLDDREVGRPHFLWVHYIDPHGPYLPPVAEVPRRFEHDVAVPLEDAQIPPYQRLEGVNDGAAYVDRYDEEIAYTDAQVGVLLEGYAARGLLDHTIVVFTADHGETMMERGVFFEHGHHVWEHLVRVPLLVRRPDAVAFRSSSPVSIADVVPSILSWLGLEPPVGLDGRPLSARGPDDLVSVESAARFGIHHRALVSRHQKWFVDTDAEGQILARWSVNLEQDPRERFREPWSDTPQARMLENWARGDPDPGGQPRGFLRGERLAGPVVVEGRDEEEIEALRALGYVR